MLKVKIETELGTTYRNMIVIDSHSHLGKDIDGAQNMNPAGPGGTFDFWSQTQGLIEQEWDKGKGWSVETKIKGKDHILTFSFEKLPFVDKLYNQLEAINSQSYKDLAKGSKHQQFIDQGVVFPFQDVYRDKKPEALYRASNINVMRFTTRFPYSLRLIGYMRCDPMEGQKAIDEVDYGFSIGARGLKLHPRSEGWIDKINSQQAIKVLAQAARYSFPVIFDTRGKSSILAIADLIKSARSYLQSNAPELLPHFKVIIAHFAQGNIDDHEVYQAICQPNTWGDLSMLHGAGATNFFKSFRSWFNQNNIKQKVDGRDWSQFLLFASDFPYFGSTHAKGLAMPILSKEFFDNGGTLEDVENILGLNQLQLLPEYNYNIVESQKIPSISSIISSNTPQVSSLDIATRSVATMVDANIIDIQKILFQFDGSYQNYKGELMISAIAKQKQEQIINLILMNLVPEKLVMLSTLSQNSAWKKFGFKYFNPDDREFFQSVFTTSRPAVDDKQAFQMIKQAF